MRVTRNRLDVLKRAAAESATDLVRDGMVVGLGSGSTAAFALEMLAERMRQGLRFTGIPTSENTAVKARAAGIPLTEFADHPRIDLTIDGADEIEAGTLNLIKGLGGALLREKIVARSSRCLAIVADHTKMVDRLGLHAPVPVEVEPFGIETTRAALEEIGAGVHLRTAETGEAFVTDGGNRILDCIFGPISDPAGLEQKINRIVGVVENGLFVGRSDHVFVADAAGVHRHDAVRRICSRAPVLVIMGVSGAGKTTVAKEIAARLGWPVEDGDALHPDPNIAKMRAGQALTDADRQPWLAAVADWIDDRRARGQPGIITCSALKRTYRRTIIGDRPDVRLIYLRSQQDLIATRLAARHGHFMPPRLLESQFETLEEPGTDESPIVINVSPAPDEIADKIIGSLA